jgi:biotin carboxyl carrier protein
VVRRYRVTVSGRTYEVEVEELASGGTAAHLAGRPAPQTSAPAPATAPSTQGEPAVTGKPAASPGRGGTVSSPLPGKVLAVRAQVGQKVKRGDLLMVIEAMKMENEIYAGEAGTVHKVHVAVGQNVETGDPLAELAAGD